MRRKEFLYRVSDPQHEQQTESGLAGDILTTLHTHRGRSTVIRDSVVDQSDIAPLILIERGREAPHLSVKCRSARQVVADIPRESHSTVSIWTADAVVCVLYVARKDVEVIPINVQGRLALKAKGRNTVIAIIICSCGEIAESDETIRAWMGHVATGVVDADLERKIDGVVDIINFVGRVVEGA